MDLHPLMHWIIHTPALFCPKGPVVECSPFRQSDIPGSYPDSEKYSRLGFLYQDLCAKLFAGHSGFTIEAEEVQLTDRGKTLGAIDFIIKNEITASLEHWEVAVKFYLLYKQSWYGPNAKDRLDKKLSHMLNHQLALSVHPLFLQRFPQWRNMTHRLLMQGRLYTNPFINDPIPAQCLGYTINSSQIRGFWCYNSQQHHIPAPLYTLNKDQWMNGQHTGIEYDSQQSEGFTHCITKDGQFWFIVPDTWPEQ